MGAHLLDNGFKVVSDIPASGVHGTLAVGTNMFDLSIRGHTLFGIDKAGSNSKLYAIDLTIPTAPVLASSVSITDNATALTVAGDFAYITGNSGSGQAIQIFNVANPSVMTSVGSLAHSLASEAIAVFGHIAVVGGGSNQCNLYDISNPALPVFIGSLPSDTGIPRGFALSGSRYLCIADHSGGTFKIYNMTDPAAVTLVSSTSAGTSPTAIQVKGRYAFSVDSTGNTLEILDLVDVASVPAATSIGTVTTPVTLAVFGTRAIVGGVNAIEMFDISTPTSPVSLGITEVTGTVTSLVMHGGLICASTATNLYVFKYTDHFMQTIRAGRLSSDHTEVTGRLQVGGPVRFSSSLNVAGPAMFSGTTGFSGKTTVGNEQVHAGPLLYKTADENVSSSTTLQNDDHLTTTLIANKTYNFKFILFITNAGATGGIKLAVNGTAGIASMKAQVTIFDDTTNAIVAFDRVTAFDSAVGIGLSSGSAYAIIEGTIEASTAGTFLLRWAQNASSASNTTVQRNSYLEITRL